MGSQTTVPPGGQIANKCMAGFLNVSQDFKETPNCYSVEKFQLKNKYR